MAGFVHRATGHSASRLIALAVSALLLTTSFGCTSLPTDVSALPTVTVTKEVAVLPPDNLIAYCVSIPSDGSIGSELKRLDNLAGCEKDRLTNLQKWSADHKTPVK